MTKPNTINGERKQPPAIGVIFSDDPSAVEKLEERIASLEARQELMKKANKAIRANDDEALRDMGFDDAKIVEMKTPGRFGGWGFRHFELTNNSANIRRLKQRQERVSAAQATPETQLDGANARYEGLPLGKPGAAVFPRQAERGSQDALKIFGLSMVADNRHLAGVPDLFRH